MSPSFEVKCFPGGSDSKESAWDAGDLVQSLGQEDPWRKEWQATPVFLPGEFHGQRSLVGWSMGLQRIGHNWVTNTQPVSLESQKTGSRVND